MSILLVEHYAPLARALVRGLAEEGIAVQVARDDVEALRCELDECNQHWPDHMAAMIDEDYQQLMKDFGLR